MQAALPKDHKTKRPIRTRLANHRGYVVNQHIDQATGAHFSLPGHNVSHMKITILEQEKINNEAYRKQREKYYINKFNTLYQGLNRLNLRGGGGFRFYVT